MTTQQPQVEDDVSLDLGEEEVVAVVDAEDEEQQDLEEIKRLAVETRKLELTLLREKKNKLAAELELLRSSSRGRKSRRYSRSSSSSYSSYSSASRSRSRSPVPKKSTKRGRSRSRSRSVSPKRRALSPQQPRLNIDLTTKGIQKLDVVKQRSPSPTKFRVTLDSTEPVRRRSPPRELSYNPFVHEAPRRAAASSPPPPPRQKRRHRGGKGRHNRKGCSRRLVSDFDMAEYNRRHYRG